ncbi:MAG TPA: HAMP domain-containing sensor histidine kinase [Bacteroidales bacterium]|nr:HAMP domain-containing sensor histidine kinase [Bacteroidales bacterium]
MSKKLLWILAFVMAIVMTGLILVQTYWIRNAFNIKEKQFAQLVARSMSNVSSEIENREAAYMLNQFLSPQVNTDTAGSGNLYFNYHMESRRSGGFARNQPYFHYDQQITIQNQNRSDSVSRDNIRIRVNNDSMTVNMTGKNGEDSLDHTGNGQPGNTRLPPDIKKRLKSKQELIDKIISKMFSPHRRIEERLSPAMLNATLDDELADNGIYLDYEYAVLRSDGAIAFKSDGYHPEKGTRIFTSQLFPQDIFNSPNYLRIYFPGQRSFLFRAVGFIGFTSVLLTMIIIAIFIFTLWVIFRQKRLSEIKNDFVNNMTHELKTPISTISLASQMLSDNSIPVANKNLSHISRVIDTESKRLGYQVEKVLQMAVLDKGRLKLREKVVDVHEIINSAVNNFSLLVKKRNGYLNWKPGAAKSVIKADEVHLTNVISNLLDNALKYCKDEPAIEISTWNQKDELVIRIEDHGIGIRKDDQKRIFEKFYRVPTGNLHNVKGFGLGLSYVKKIVEIHNGSIELKSELNKGTRFDIFLPLYEN